MGGPDRLFHHDRRVAINAMRATFAGWHDRLILSAIILAMLAAMRSWFVDRAWDVAAGAAFGIAALAGLSVANAIETRLTFHGTDGLLAADALRPWTRRRYVIAWHGVGFAILTAVLLVAGPSYLWLGAMGYIAGALAAPLARGIAIPGAATAQGRSRWAICRWLHHPAAGVAGAAILLLSLLPLHMIEENARLAMIGIAAVVLTTALTGVDDGVVRFMTVAGKSSHHIITRHARGVLTFVGIAGPAAWLAAGPATAGVVAVAALAMLLLMAMRILAYRRHAKRSADLLISVFSAILIGTAFFVLLILPLIVVAVLWRLQRRAAGQTWLLS